jgi:thiol-disulfide isomerase/thioredoxin
LIKLSKKKKIMKFKKLIMGLLCFVLPALAMAQSIKYTVTGSVNPSHNGELVSIAHTGPGKTSVKDSAVVTNGAFTITGEIAGPSVAYVRLGKVQPANSLDIYLSPGTITITAADSLIYAKVSGNKLAEDYSRLMEKVHPLVKEKLAYSIQFAAIPVTERKGEAARPLIAKLLDISKNISEAIYDFIDNNPTSYISLDFLQKISGSVINYNIAILHFDKLSDALKNSAEGKAFHEKIMASQSMQIGTVAKGFESTTPDGKKLALQDVVKTGKYTLIDFWASWCGPCRKENPNVVNAYNTYHDKGFNILSVSLDTKAESWKAAIAKDGMPWNHVSSLLGWKEPAAELYGVHAIPQNVLLDSKGVVVATNLRGEALLEKLKQLLM